MRTCLGSELGTQVFIKDEPMAERLLPIVGFGMAKPHGGGMWTSSLDEDGDSDWIKWCQANDFHSGTWVKWLLTPDPHASIVEVDSYDDLYDMHKAYKGTSEPFVSVGLPHLDFHSIAAHYDGMHLTEEGQWATRLTYPYALYGWDCESTLWFRWSFKEVVRGEAVVING